MPVSTRTAARPRVSFDPFRIAFAGAYTGFDVASPQALSADQIGQSPDEFREIDHDAFCDGTVDLGGVLVSSIDDTVVDRSEAA